MAHEKTTFFMIDRKLLDSGLWTREPFTRGQAWVDLIGMANYGDVKRVEGSEIKTYERGTVVTSILALSKRWQWSRHKVSDFILALESDTMLTQNRTSTGIVLKLENYTFYQSRYIVEGQRKDNDGTTKGQRKDNDGTQKKNNKEYKNTQEERESGLRHYGPRGRLSLTAEELEKFRADYPENAERFIEELDEYKGAMGKEYKNDFEALKRWAKNDAKYSGANTAGSKYRSGLEIVMEEVENGTFK